jgi:hypothetical protein
LLSYGFPFSGQDGVSQIQQIVYQVKNIIYYIITEGGIRGKAAGASMQNNKSIIHQHLVDFNCFTEKNPQALEKVLKNS